MLHSVPGTSANRNITKLAAAAAAMTVLAGCAMAVPLHPSATSSQDSRDFYCRADPKCSHRSAERRIAYRRSHLVDGSQIHNPPDFILKGGEQEGTLR
jgi:hypothetical protein